MCGTLESELIIIPNWLEIESTHYPNKKWPTVCLEAYFEVPFTRAARKEFFVWNFLLGFCVCIDSIPLSIFSVSLVWFFVQFTETQERASFVDQELMSSAWIGSVWFV